MTIGSMLRSNCTIRMLPVSLSKVVETSLRLLKALLLAEKLKAEEVVLLSLQIHVKLVKLILGLLVGHP